MAVMAAFPSSRTSKTCTGSMITRIKNYEKRAPSRDARKVYIICEGKGTEPDYFSFFEGLSSNLQIIVIPPENGTDPLKLMALANRKLLDETSKFSMDYMANDSVWFVIDTDTWEEEGKIASLRGFCNDQNATISERYSEVKSYQGWNVVQSNPCFEIWLYYHFYDKEPDTSVVESYTSFKEFVSTSITGGFNFQRDPVRLQDAISNSSATFSIGSDGGPDLYSTEVFHLGEEILPFVRRHLDRLTRKMR